MANTVFEQNNEGAGLTSISRLQRLWVLGILLGAFAAVALGLWLAASTAGVARPSTGTAFVIAMGLALVVGASKTSSA
jgi:hypothetical protein